MKDDILFYEKQAFWHNWLMIAAMFVVCSLLIWGFIQQVILGATWGNNPMSNLGLIIAMSCMVLFFIGLLLFQMQMYITEEGIYLRYSPFDVKTRFFAWETIEYAFVRKYNPMMEYGGWGIKFRYNPYKGKVYNMYGNMGLQLVFNNGKRVLIGTQKADELTEVLNKLDGKRNQK